MPYSQVLSFGDVVKRTQSPMLFTMIINPWHMVDGGFLDSHEIPAGRGAFGSFEELAQQNKRIIRKLLESSSDSSTVSDSSSYDEQTLAKLQSYYASCTNEDLLNERDSGPLLDVVKVVKALYRSHSTKIIPLASQDVPAGEKEQDGLTAAVAFLHSRGRMSYCLLSAAF